MTTDSARPAKTTCYLSTIIVMSIMSGSVCSLLQEATLHAHRQSYQHHSVWTEA